MTQIHIAIIHGIGKNGPGFSADLTGRIAREFNLCLRRILKSPEDYAGDLDFIEIVWDDLFAYNQAKLADIFRSEFKRRSRKEKIHYGLWAITYLAVTFVFSFIFKNPWLFAFLAFGAFFVAKTKLQKLRTDIAAEFINDLISYREKDAQKLVLDRVNDRLRPLANLPGGSKVNFISHSLGTVIASDYVWEEQKPGRFFDQKVKVNNFFTMGSPLPLFSLQFGGPEMFTKPLALQEAAGRWVNIYDNDDPIAYPLKCLNEVYNRIVLKDHEVDVGWFGIAHVNYWTSDNVARVMAHKFALDWLRENASLPEAELGTLADQYDRTLVLF